MNYRKAGEFIKNYVEQLYNSTFYTLQEKLAYAKRPKENPYPAQYSKINGIPYEGEITCGSNPFLHGRIVKNIYIIKAKNGKVCLNWGENQLSSKISMRD